MAKKDVKAVLAENVAYLTGLDENTYKSDRALALAAKLAPNTVMNIKKRRHSVQVDNLEALAEKLPKVGGLKCEAWMLLHPDLRRALRALELLEAYEKQDRERSKEDDTARANSALSTKAGGRRETQREGT